MANQVKKVRYGWYRAVKTAPNPCMPSQPTIFRPFPPVSKNLPEKGVYERLLSLKSGFLFTIYFSGVKIMRGRLTSHKHCKRWSVKNLPAWFLLVFVWSGLCWTTVPLPSCLANRIDLKKTRHSHVFLKGFWGNKNPWTHELLLVVFVS